jgi:hypothetical protein
LNRLKPASQSLYNGKTTRYKENLHFLCARLFKVKNG